MDRDKWREPRSRFRIIRPAALTLLAATASALPWSANQVAARPASLSRSDISSPVDIADGNCSFGPMFDRAFENMISYDRGRSPRARPVDIGRQRLMPRLTASRADGTNDPSFRNYDSVVRLGRPARWNGLRLTGLSSSTGWEWGATSLEFADRPERVRAAMRAIGLELPLPPESRDIPLDACSAAIAIEARGSGSALACSSGC